MGSPEPMAITGSPPKDSQHHDCSSSSDHNAVKMPECLQGQFDTLEAATKALDIFRHGINKGITRSAAGSGGSCVLYVCPQQNCGFKVTIRRCRKGAKDTWYWFFDQSPAHINLVHLDEVCSSEFETPLWMIMEHPVFLENMVKPVKLQMSRKDLKAALASPPGIHGQCHGLRCSFDQLKRAKSQWREDAVRNFEDCVKRLPHWMDMYRSLNPEGDAVLERTEAGQFYRAVLLPPGLQSGIATLFIKVCIPD